jgi:hypothetical protein
MRFTFSTLDVRLATRVAGLAVAASTFIDKTMITNKYKSNNKRESDREMFMHTINKT